MFPRSALFVGLIILGALRAGAASLPHRGEMQLNQVVKHDQVMPSIARADSGASVVVWCSQWQDSDGSYGIYGRRLDSNGSPVGGEFAISENQLGTQTQPAIAMAPSGEFVVVWVEVNGDVKRG